jgi:hypothetical protein
MKAQGLLRLYPPSWRDRYGDEFLEMAGEDQLSVQQVIDITSGAIDAWLSPDVRMATRPTTGGAMTLRALVCRGEPRYTKRDSLVAAAVMIALTSAFALSGIVVKREGWTIASKMLLNLSFIVPFTLSMPLWLMKGQPWKANAVLIGTTVAFLVVLSFLSAI